MKNKKFRLFFLSLVFGGLVFSSSVWASECTDNGGTCQVQLGSGCDAGFNGFNGMGCSSGQICCVSNTSTQGKLLTCYEDCAKSGVTGSALLSCRDNCQTTNLAACCVNSTAKTCTSVSTSNGSCPSGYAPSTQTCAALTAAGQCSGSGGGTNGGNNNSGTTGGPTQVIFTNPIPFTTISEVLNSVLSNMMGIIALIAIIFIIIGGILYMTSAGDEKRMTRAKNTWTAAVIGFAIAIAAPTFLKEIKKILGDKNGKTADDWVDKALTIKQIALNVLSFLFGVVGIFAIIAIVVGGFFYLTAYGDEDRMKTGKKIVTWAVIGIAVALSALVAVRQVANLIGAGSFM